MGKCVVIAGGVGSGKTTLAKAFEEYGYKRIVTYTTRDKRPYERHGEDYHFISDHEFRLRLNDGFFAEVTTYNAGSHNYLYGSAREDYICGDKKVIVLNSQGIINLEEDVFVIYLDIDERIRVKRAKERGDLCQQLRRRLKDDELYLEELFHKRIPDLRICYDLNDETIFETVHYVGKMLELESK